MKSLVHLFLGIGLLVLLPLLAVAQKPQLPAASTAPSIKANGELKLSRRTPAIPTVGPRFSEAPAYETLPGGLALPASTSAKPGQIWQAEDKACPIAISGWAEKRTSNNTILAPVEEAYAYLNAWQSRLLIDSPGEEFVLRQKHQDALGREHLRMKQVYQGIPVFGAELIVHLSEGKADFVNGRFFPTPTLESLSPTLLPNVAIDKVRNDLANYTKVKELQANDYALLPTKNQYEHELVIYHVEGKEDGEKLAWQITAFPNITQRWEYFIDAQDGTILHRLQNSCQFFHTMHDLGEEVTCNHEHDHEPDPVGITTESRLLGPETASARDLQNEFRLINVYETGGTYYMMDASRDMHNANASSFPDDPVGVVVTLDAGNTSPQNSNFNYDYIRSNVNDWNDPNSVSAHFNGGEAYHYFEQVHERNSVNGSGGNIISVINVSDENGNDMDNAFWNGAAMFYGNGRQAFNAPLAKSLDVAGHEMSHGVIQGTANLTYENQSGALNESFADIFGAMLDREDWQIGEDVANPSVFPTGTMRDMQDPHNGGNSNDFYWQPKHLDEFVNLPNTPQGDFGGVHINSGIPNHAYYLFATSVGKDVAEQVFYKALEDYLVASSQFVDLRIAVLRAAGDLFNQSVVDAAATAFSQVGIGDGPGGEYQNDIEENQGREVILAADLNQTELSLFYFDGSSADQLTTTAQSSRPSISDDGSFVVFVDNQNRLKGIDINWTNGQVDEFFLEDPAQSIWRNIAVSKDGSKVAFLYELTNDEVRNRQIAVFDYVSESSEVFELYNPTTSSDGSSTGDVRFADVLEWDNTGQYLLYDSFNELTGSGGQDISYWDIGLIRVWDNDFNNFSDGVITKLFSGLQENESIGNPTFAKNSPYIIAFDYFATDPFGQETYILYGANIETNDISIIDDQIFKLSYPSYAPSDQQILYSDINNGSDIIIQQDIASDKINGAGNWSSLINNSTWALWFATGSRDLVAIEDPAAALQLQLFPNPFNDQLQLQWTMANSQQVEVTLYDMLGQNQWQQSLATQAGSNQLLLPGTSLAPGTYSLHLRLEDGNTIVQKVLKL